MTPSLRSDLIFLWLGATTALCLGLLLNQFRDSPLPLIYQNKAERLQESVQRITNAESPPASAQISSLPEMMSLQEFSSFVDNKQGVILDARPEIFHRLGHVPGALSLPREDFEDAFTKLRDKLEPNRSQPIVIYCSGSSCEDSHLVKTSLAALGFTNVAIFEGGWSAWTSAGKPEETAN